MTKAILFCGARLSGKDLAITHLKQKDIPLVVRECKDKLHLLTREFFCLTEERYWQIYNARSLKEKALEDFNVTLLPDEYLKLHRMLSFQGLSLDGFDGVNVKVSMSIREAMIYVSEIICKPRFGNNYFGVARAKSILEGEIIVDGSTGFQEELPPLIERVGKDNILLLRIHREGCTFEGDSRSLIPDGVIKYTVDVYNNSTEEAYLESVYKTVKRFLNE